MGPQEVAQLASTMPNEAEVISLNLPLSSCANMSEIIIIICGSEKIKEKIVQNRNPSQIELRMCQTQIEFEEILLI